MYHEILEDYKTLNSVKTRVIFIHVYKFNFQVSPTCTADHIDRCNNEK